MEKLDTSVLISNGGFIVNCTDKEYFSMPEVSNSDINWLREQASCRDSIGNKDNAYRFGTLLDAVVTESERVDFFKKTLDGEPVIREEWNKALKMRKSFFADPFCMNIYRQCKGQVVVKRDVEIEFSGIKFILPMRCKWDFLDYEVGKVGSDLKSTAATSQDQFAAVVSHFNYDQQMSVYMDITGIDYVALIGVSKVNYKVFKIIIKRGDELFSCGMNKFRYWAWKYYTLFY